MLDERRAWLLDPGFPTVRRLAATRLPACPAPETGPAPDTAAERAPRIADEPWVAALLGEPATDRPHPYQKWTGVHWRLVALAELDADPADPDVARFVEDGFERVAAWVSGHSRMLASRAIDGRVRQCASMDGNAAWAAIRLGRATDPRVADIIERLLDWQWPDGGWNCDKRPVVTHASFNETLGPLRALSAFATRGPAGGLRDQADLGRRRAAELFLAHRVDRSHRTGEIAHPAMLRLRWPAYWHYDRLQGLRALREAGVLDDPRCHRALADLAAAATADGTWVPDGRYWRSSGPLRAGREVVDWKRTGEARMLTLQALEALEERRTA